MKKDRFTVHFDYYHAKFGDRYYIADNETKLIILDRLTLKGAICIAKCRNDQEYGERVVKERKKWFDAFFG